MYHPRANRGTPDPDEQPTAKLKTCARPGCGSLIWYRTLPNCAKCRLEMQLALRAAVQDGALSDWRELHHLVGMREREPWMDGAA